MDSTLATSIDRLDHKIDSVYNKLDSKIDGLAIAVAKGFEQVHTRIDDLQEDMNEQYGKVKKDIFCIEDTYSTKEELQKVKELL